MQISSFNVFGIAGYRQFNSTFSNGFDASSNFTITASSANITLGGPQNLNEGILVEYSIHANPNSSGTYNYDFRANIFMPLFVFSFGDCRVSEQLFFGAVSVPPSPPLHWRLGAPRGGSIRGRVLTIKSL